MNKKLTITIFFWPLWLAFQQQVCRAQEAIAPKISWHKNHKLQGLSAGLAIGYTSSLVMLHKAWYKPGERSSFHFYNDLPDWNQIDKAGHFFTAFHYSRMGIDAFKWAGIPHKKAILYGGLLGIVFQTPIEIFDGLSPNYGASKGDALANVAGSLLAVGQELAWGGQRIMPKYSFHTTNFATQRPDFFGYSLANQMLKDYNGQSYWLSVDLSSFLPKEGKYPKWLNFAVGYGSEGMMYGNPGQNLYNGYNPYRRFFLSPDINLMNIKTKSKFLQKTFYVLSAFRIPMPAVEFNSRKQFIFHPVYF